MKLTEETAKTKSEFSALLFNRKNEGFHDFTRFAEKILDKYAQQQNAKLTKDLTEMLETVFKSKYVQYPESEEPLDYPKRILRAEGFLDALKMIENFNQY